MNLPSRKPPDDTIYHKRSKACGGRSSAALDMSRRGWRRPLSVSRSRTATPVGRQSLYRTVPTEGARNQAMTPQRKVLLAAVVVLAEADSTGTAARELAGRSDDEVRGGRTSGVGSSCSTPATPWSTGCSDDADRSPELRGRGRRTPARRRRAARTRPAEHPVHPPAQRSAGQGGQPVAGAVHRWLSLLIGCAAVACQT
jgi:hypothetical protein